MLSALVQVTLGFLYANLFEWLWHKYVFHGLGKKKKSRFSSHWRKHHRAVRKNFYIDESYKEFSGFAKDPMREVYELLFAALVHSPLFLIFPYFVFHFRAKLADEVKGFSVFVFSLGGREAADEQKITMYKISSFLFPQHLVEGLLNFRRRVCRSFWLDLAFQDPPGSKKVPQTCRDLPGRFPTLPDAENLQKRNFV